MSRKEVISVRALRKSSILASPLFTVCIARRPCSFIRPISSSFCSRYSSVDSRVFSRLSFCWAIARLSHLSLWLAKSSDPFFTSNNVPFMIEIWSLMALYFWRSSSNFGLSLLTRPISFLTARRAILSWDKELEARFWTTCCAFSILLRLTLMAPLSSSISCLIFLAFSEPPLPALMREV